jgi:hypothetical protein
MFLTLSSWASFLETSLPLSPAQRFYQRMIAMNAEDADDLVEQLLKDQSVIDVYDNVIIPAISLAEEGRHAGFLDSAIEGYFWRARES